jgi:alkaline phosphatase
LPFERFDRVALVKTYNTNQQVADSAGTATAMLSGEKTKAGVIGIGPTARRRNCEDALQNTGARLGERHIPANG